MTSFKDIIDKGLYNPAPTSAPEKNILMLPIGSNDWAWMNPQVSSPSVVKQTLSAETNPPTIPVQNNQVIEGKSKNWILYSIIALLILFLVFQMKD